VKELPEIYNMKKLISHRGNINGPNPEMENNPIYITEALNLGFDVEIDVWYVNNSFYLGHNEPTYKIDVDFLMNRGMWCHAKNEEALRQMIWIDGIHCFWHQNDDYTLTSEKIMWVYPGKKLPANSICVLPEINNVEEYILKDCLGVCSDYINNYIWLN
jgi:hypothetical protein